MSDALPPGWAIAPLARVAQLGFGQSPPSSTYNSTGKGLPFFQGKAEFGDRYPTVEKWCTNPTRIAEEGDILLSVRAPVGPTNVAPLRCGIGRGLASIRPVGSVPTDYILYFLKLIAARLASKGTGTTFGAITKSVVEGIEIPLAPQGEQKRIASKLDELFSRIEEGEQALARVQKLVERYRQSVLKAAVTGELTREWREKRKAAGEPVESGAALLERILAARRAAWEQAELAKFAAKGKTPANVAWKQKYQEPAPPDTSDLPELPEGWVWASVGQIGTVSGGLTKNQKRKDCDVQRPYLRVANVYANRLDLSEVERIGVNESELNRVLLRKDDLLVVEGNGSIEQIGRVALWDGSIDGCVHQNHIIKVRCSTLLPSWYVLLWCMSPLGREQIQRVASSTAGLHTLSLSKVESLPVPIPATTELATILERFEQMKSLVTSQRDEIKGEALKSVALRQAVLKSAFSGQLVPQDPNDEPASVLLERIAAERGAARSLSLGPSPARGEGGKTKRGRKRKDARHPRA